jgi:hypothetical protein
MNSLCIKNYRCRRQPSKIEDKDSDQFQEPPKPQPKSQEEIEAEERIIAVFEKTISKWKHGHFISTLYVWN